MTRTTKPRQSRRRGKQRPQVFKALAHPLRMRLLAAMSEREASPSELAEELGEPLGNVSYHVRMLEQLGCIELVRTTPRRGALEHHYRAVVRPLLEDEDWEQVPSSARRSISAGTLSEIWSDLTQALNSGSFDERTDRHVSWTNLSLDDQGWSELNGALAELVDRALEIQAKSAARVHEEEEGASTFTSKLVLMHYEPAADERKHGKQKSAKSKQKPKGKAKAKAS